VIELILGPEVESHFSEIAFHRYCGASAGDIGNAIESCRRAGIFASSHLAYEEAALQFSRGLELAEKSASQNAELRCDLLLALGAEEVRSGERDSAAANFARAAAVARTLGDAERLASAALGRFPGFFAVEAGAPDQFAIDLLREAIAVTPVDQERMRALLLARLAMAISWCDGAGEREGLTAEASRIALAHGDSSLRLQVSLARWFAEWEPEQFEKRWAIADLLMADGGRHGDRETVLLCRLFHATCLLERGEIREFKRQVAIFEEAASHLRQPEALWYSALLQAMFSLHLGRLQEADALSRRFAELGQIVRDANVFHSRTSHRVLLAWETGDLDEMIDAASEGSDAFPAMDGWHAAKAWALARAGRVAEAQRTIHIVARDGVSGIPRRMDWMVTLATLGEASVLVGDLVRAREVFEEMACLRGRVIVLGLCVATWGCASRYLGTLARSLGKWELAEELLREAVEVDTRTEANAWAAWSKYELGDLLVSRPAASIASSHEGSNWLAAAGECAQALDLRWLKTKLASRNLLLYDGTKY
jgi:tetratricopeptide (TPR) repeat protein